MKKEKAFILVCILAFLFAACTEDVPMSVNIDAGQFELGGKTANVVHSVTDSIVFVRDSVADEKHDTLYNIRTSITLVLDSVYYTDQLEEKLELQICSDSGNLLSTLTPADSLIEDSLIVYLQKKQGQSFEIAFEGEIGRKALLKMKDGAKVSLNGFSFVYADPKITKKLSLYEEYIKGMRKWSKDAQQYQRSVTNGINALGGGFIYMLVIRRAMDESYKLDAQLAKQKDKMTAKQLECYQACHKELLSYGPKTWI